MRPKWKMRNSSDSQILSDSLSGSPVKMKRHSVVEKCNSNSAFESESVENDEKD